MKRFIIFQAFLISFIAIAVLSSCAGLTTPSGYPLEIATVDTNGDPIAGLQCSLISNDSSYVVSVVYTSPKGQATFLLLEPVENQYSGTEGISYVTNFNINIVDTDITNNGMTYKSTNIPAINATSGLTVIMYLQ